MEDHGDFKRYTNAEWKYRKLQDENERLARRTTINLVHGLLMGLCLGIFLGLKLSAYV